MSSISGFSDKCEIRKNEKFGRYVTAAKDIKAGEILLKEKPIIIIPQSNENLFCSNCFDEFSTICKKCNIFPLCSHCINHDQFECDFFHHKFKDEKENEIQFNNNNNNLNDFFIKYPKTFGIIKCLIFMEMDLKNTNNELWKNFLKMESHIQERKNTNIWYDNKKMIIEPIINSKINKYFTKNMVTDNDCDDGNEINEEFLQKICGILDVNTFELRRSTTAVSSTSSSSSSSMSSFTSENNKLVHLRGVYMNAALLAHNCVPNTMITVDSQYNLKIYATIDINGNEIIYNNYTNPLWATNERHEHLKIGKYFLCECERCKDPTEFQTYLNAFKCNLCIKNDDNNDSYLLYHYDKDIWICEKCSTIKESKEIKKILNKIQQEIYECGTDLYKLEILLKKYEKILNRKHYLMIDIKQIIASKLRQICEDNNNNNGINCALLLQRKIEICEEILNIIKKLQPGISRLKALTLYEYYIPLYELIDQQYENDVLSKDEYLNKLKLCESILKESLDILAYEPINTPEGQLARSGLFELKELRENIKYVERNT